MFHNRKFYGFLRFCGLGVQRSLNLFCLTGLAFSIISLKALAQTTSLQNSAVVGVSANNTLGNASYQFAGATGTVDIGNGTQAIINWSALGIQSGETLQFNSTQPAIFLNKVTGNDASLLNGQIVTNQAGSSLIFINPNGIEVGSQFQVSTNVDRLMFSTQSSYLSQASELSTLTAIEDSLVDTGSGVLKIQNTGLGNFAGTLYLYAAGQLQIVDTQPLSMNALVISADDAVNLTTAVNEIEVTTLNHQSITLVNQGDLVLNGINAQTGQVSIQVDGNVQQGTGAIVANELALQSEGLIGTEQAPILTDVAQLTIGGVSQVATQQDVYISENNGLVLVQAEVGNGDLLLKTPGQLSLAGNIQANALVLETGGDLIDTEQARIVANQFSFRTQGQVNLSQLNIKTLAHSWAGDDVRLKNQAEHWVMNNLIIFSENASQKTVDLDTSGTLELTGAITASSDIQTHKLDDAGQVGFDQTLLASDFSANRLSYLKAIKIHTQGNLMTPNLAHAGFLKAQEFEISVEESIGVEPGRTPTAQQGLKVDWQETTTGHLIFIFKDDDIGTEERLKVTLVGQGRQTFSQQDYIDGRFQLQFPNGYPASFQAQNSLLDYLEQAQLNLTQPGEVADFNLNLVTETDRQAYIDLLLNQVSFEQENVSQQETEQVVSQISETTQESNQNISVEQMTENSFAETDNQTTVEVVETLNTQQETQQETINIIETTETTQNTQTTETTTTEVVTLSEQTTEQNQTSNEIEQLETEQYSETLTTENTTNNTETNQTENSVIAGDVNQVAETNETTQSVQMQDTESNARAESEFFPAIETGDLVVQDAMAESTLSEEEASSETECILVNEQTGECMDRVESFEEVLEE